PWPIRRRGPGLMRLSRRGLSRRKPAWQSAVPDPVSSPAPAGTAPAPHRFRGGTSASERGNETRSSLRRSLRLLQKPARRAAHVPDDAEHLERLQRVVAEVDLPPEEPLAGGALVVVVVVVPPL